MDQQHHYNPHRRTDPTAADRSADIVLAAAVIAMGLLAGLIYDCRSPSCRP